MITEPEIFARLTALHSALVEKLGAQPWTGTPTLMIDHKCRIYIRGPLKRGRMSGRTLHTATADTIEGALADAEAFVAAMPDPTAKARHDWHCDLSKVIDRGHDLALPDDVMQPLRASSQAMHKNLLAAPEAAE